MKRERVRALLKDVAAGRADIDTALAILDAGPVESLPFASIDHHRALRHGFPEVVFGEGKTAGQVVAICEKLAERSGGFLVTRSNAEQRAALRARFPSATENVLARTVRFGDDDGPAGRKARRGRGTKRKPPTLIVTAGTADLPVAEEAAETMLALGLSAERMTDVGVAGIHRVLAKQRLLMEAGVVIVVAGMDGALPSVIGGLVRAPVIAVPTSVGYGASFRGLAALLTMLNSCAAGVTVCNIDNGFGAAVSAFRILSA